MIGVLLFSTEAGRISGWTAVRGSTEIRVSGMSQGDLVEIRFRGNGHDKAAFMALSKDSSFGLPEGVEYVRAEHKVAGENPDVCVELF